MLAAILTISGAMTFVSCTSEVDNPIVPVQPEEPTGQDVSQFPIAQIAAEVQGLSVDPVMFVFTNQVRLYDIDADGKCNVYDLTENKDSLGNEEVSVIQYSGTWKVTNDLSRLHFVDALDLEGYDMMGGLMLQTEMQFDDDDEFASMFGTVEVKDTLAVLRDTEDGELLFINRNNTQFLANLYETGMIDDSGKSATRAATRALSSSDIEKKIKEITGDENYRQLLQPVMFKGAIYMSDWMGNYYKGLNPRVCDMSIPGSRLSTTYYIADYKANLTPYMFMSKTQYLDIEKQWKQGVRFFDFGAFMLRSDALYPASYEHFIIHGSDLKIYLGEIKRLLKEHPGETAIIMFNNHLNDFKYQFEMFAEIYGAYSNRAEQIYQYLQDEMKDCMVENYAPGIRLNDCRGKVLVMNRHEEDLKDKPIGLHLTPLWPAGTTVAEGLVKFPNGDNGKVYVQAIRDYYVEEGAEPKEKLKAIDKAWNYAASINGSAEPVWVINYAAGGRTDKQPTSTESIDYRNNSYNAFYANARIEHLVCSNIGANKAGIIVFDFVGKDGRGLCNCINFDCKGFAPPIELAMNNFHLVNRHTISLDEGDMVK